MRKKFPLHIKLLVLSIALYASGCVNSKQLPYFKDLSEISKTDTVKGRVYHPLKLRTNDVLQIIINSSSPEAAQFFNLAPSQGENSLGDNTNNMRFKSVGSGYRVTEKGAINLPVLGDITVAGLTTEELKNLLTTKLKDYLKDIVVTINLTNFKVTVIGEVSNPIVVPVEGEIINVLEAIGAAGDMTVYGIRKNVKVLRKLDNGDTEIGVLDFNKSETLNSPYFQLHQNDIVYVQPNKNKGLVGTAWQIWIPIITSIATIVTIVLTLQ